MTEIVVFVRQCQRDKITKILKSWYLSYSNSGKGLCISAMYGNNTFYDEKLKFLIFYFELLVSCVEYLKLNT